jgi:ribosome-associated protein
VPTGRKRRPTAARAKRAPRALAPPPLLATIVTALEDGLADDIARIDLAGKTGIADFMVIASGRSARQVAALADRVLAALGERGYRRAPIEGLKTGDWVLIDAGDVIVHIFRPEVRARYNLEKMWGASFGEESGGETA